jgi:hypothetical protein
MNLSAGWKMQRKQKPEPGESDEHVRNFLKGKGAPAAGPVVLIDN